MHLAKSAAVVVIAAAASGGIALAAASPSGAPAQPGRELPSNAASQAQEHAAVPLSSHPSGKPAKSSHGKAAGHGTPHPNLNGLCHAWLAGAGSQHGKARSNPAFTALITAAGGESKVAGYCATVIKTHPTDADSDDPDESTEAAKPAHPTKPAHASSHAHGTPSASHPNGPPSGVGSTK
jgi:hypothetical protein